MTRSIELAKPHQNAVYDSPDAWPVQRIVNLNDIARDLREDYYAEDVPFDVFVHSRLRTPIDRPIEGYTPLARDRDWIQQLGYMHPELVLQNGRLPERFGISGRVCDILDVPTETATGGGPRGTIDYALVDLDWAQGEVLKEAEIARAEQTGTYPLLKELSYAYGVYPEDITVAHPLGHLAAYADQHDFRYEGLVIGLDANPRDYWVDTTVSHNSVLPHGPHSQLLDPSNPERSPVWIRDLLSKIAPKVDESLLRYQVSAPRVTSQNKLIGQ